MTVHRLQIKRKKKTVFKDFFPICFIAIFGCFGFAYIFNSDCISEFKNSQKNSKVYLASNSLSLGAIFSDRENALNIEGNYLSGSKMQFELPNFDPSARYILEIKGLPTVEIKNEAFSYTFADPGKYELNLNIQYPNRSAEVWSRSITIDDGSQLTMNGNLDNI